jgi:CNT family concentrative nucleoside transporter
MHILVGMLGLVVMMLIAWAISEDRRRMDWRLIGVGVGLQFVLVYLVLKTSGGRLAFEGANDAINVLISMSDEGVKFVFGEGYAEHYFAFKVLSTIIFVSSLSSVLFYLGIMQRIVSAMAWVMARSMGASGTESLAAAANVFVGQTEAPLLIKPYLKTMTRSELGCLMTGGMATVAGGVMAAYVSFGISAGHLLAASIMSAPAAIVIAKIIWPETEQSLTRGSVQIKLEIADSNVIEAACNGASEGLKLALNVAAMLIAFIALVAMVNYGLGRLGSLAGGPLDGITLQQIFGWVMQPLAWLMGVTWEECRLVGEFLGERTVLNEFIAYVHLSEKMKAGLISERSAVIATYALCGFANFSSVAIQIGGIGAMEPSRHKDFARAGFKAMIGGTLASYMTATIAGMFL